MKSFSYCAKCGVNAFLEDMRRTPFDEGVKYIQS